MIEKSEKIKAVFFDYGGTLDAQGVAWKERFYPLYLQAGLRIEPDTFARAFYASDDSLVAENPRHLNLSQIVHEQVKRVLLHLGTLEKGLENQIASRFLADSFSAIERNKPLLKMLKKRFKLGIISNNYGNLEMICRETGLDTLLDVMVDSNLVGCTKPEPKIFWAGLEALETEPSRAVMVGDSLARDIKGAKALGMKAVWLDGTGNNPSGRQWAGACCVISDLKRLLPLLGL